MLKAMLTRWAWRYLTTNTKTGQRATERVEELADRVLGHQTPASPDGAVAPLAAALRAIAIFRRK
jgi:hypothetical protein